ncbi:MAG: type IV secretion system protein [Bacteroidota bacterium]
MIKFDYDFIYSYYDRFLNENQLIFYSIISFKFVAISMALINFYSLYINARDKEKGESLQSKDIIRFVVIISLIVSYDYILWAFDELFLAFENAYSKFEAAPKRYQLKKDIQTEDTNTDVYATLKRAAGMFIEVLTDPGILFLKFISLIIWIIDVIIYAIFLAERFFILGILRIFGALAIALSTYAKFEKYFWAWIGSYLSYGLVIVPYFIVNLFTNGIYTITELLISENLPKSTLTYSTPLTIVMLLIVILKFKLFSRSGAVLNKIFN